MTTAGKMIRMEYAGQNLTLKEWAEETGLSYSAIYRRYVSLGWSPEETLTIPARERGGGPLEEGR